MEIEKLKMLKTISLFLAVLGSKGSKVLESDTTKNVIVMLGVMSPYLAGHEYIFHALPWKMYS